MDTMVTDTRKYDSRSRDQYGVSLGWNNQALGAFNAVHSVSKNFDGGKSNHLLVSWNKQFKYATVGLNVEQSQNTSATRASSPQFSAESLYTKAIYFTISAPIGSGRRIGAYTRKRNGTTRFGTSFSDSTNDVATYRLTASQDNQTRARDFSANLNLLPRYSQLDVGYSQNGTDNSNYNAHISGGVAMQDEAITLSPYQLNDTFGVVKVGKLSGVKLDTPGGPVWTDPWGRAAVAQMSAYQKSRIEVKTKSLPRNVDIKNGLQELTLARGAVGSLDFAVEAQRRALLLVTDADGKPPRKGAAVLDAQGQYLTSVVDGGQVFLTGAQLDQKLSIRLDGENSCSLKFALSEEPDFNVFLERVDAICIGG
jgi:outer membrane usher protein FimD/PapC